MRDRDLEAAFYGIIAASYTHAELEALIKVSERINEGWSTWWTTTANNQRFFRGFAA
jgi:hypothetical protein